MNFFPDLGRLASHPSHSRHFLETLLKRTFVLALPKARILTREFLRHFEVVVKRRCDGLDGKGTNRVAIRLSRSA